MYEERKATAHAELQKLLEAATMSKCRNCPKDDYPMPRIDTLVEKATGCEMLSMLNCFSSYHQIHIKESDEEKTSFITPSGVFCFVRMPEGLKNTGSTFNRAIDEILGSQKGCNISAYVDNVVVLSKKKEDHIKDLCETFANLCKHGLKLNLEKCAFEVMKEKLLGCLVSQEGIQANPEKVETIRNMQAPCSKREVQKLAGRIASLNRFISKSAEESLRFFAMLRNVNLKWGQR